MYLRNDYKPQERDWALRMFNYRSEIKTKEKLILEYWYVYGNVQSLKDIDKNKTNKVQREDADKGKSNISILTDS